jgi:hypothetical protein
LLVANAVCFLLKVYIIEANPRASRTVPFVAKAVGHPIVKYASLLMAGKSLAEIGFTEEPKLNHVAVKEAVLPFDKFPGKHGMCCLHFDPACVVGKLWQVPPCLLSHQGHCAVCSALFKSIGLLGRRRRHAAGAGDAVDGGGDGH